MFYLFGQKYILDDVSRLTNSSYNTEDLSILKKSYNQFLSKNSIFEVEVDWDYPKIINFATLSHYAPKFCEERKSFYSKNSFTMEKKISNDFFGDGLNKLKKINPSLGEIIDLLVRVIVINKLDKYFEGTTNYTLGLSNMDLHDIHSIIDFQELLLHQTTHMIIFINDRVNLQIPDNLKNFEVEANFDHKAGGNSFQLYIGYHSYLVGIEVLLHRSLTGTLDYNGKYHGTTQRIINKCHIGRDLIMPYLAKFTPHGQEIMKKANTHLDRITRLHIPSDEKIPSKTILQENNK